MSARAAWSTHLRPTRWCVLISGTGSNLAALLEQPETEVRLVLSSSGDAPGCAKARRAGVTLLEIPRLAENGIAGKKIDWPHVDQILRSYAIDAIFLLGFMRIVPASFIDAWSGRILNLHPSLLPKHPGLKSIERSFLAKDDCGATVHTVVADVDAGPIHTSRISVRDEELSEFNIEAVETLVHIDEQRLVKETAKQWRPEESR